MIVEEIIADILRLISGTLGYYYVNRYIEKKINIIIFYKFTWDINQILE